MEPGNTFLVTTSADPRRNDPRSQVMAAKNIAHCVIWSLVRAGVMRVYKQSLYGERTSWCSCGPEMLSMIGHGGKFGGSIESNLFHLKIHMMWKCEEEKRGYFRAIFSSQVFRPSVWVDLLLLRFKLAIGKSHFKIPITLNLTLR